MNNGSNIQKEHRPLTDKNINLGYSFCDLLHKKKAKNESRCTSVGMLSRENIDLAKQINKSSNLALDARIVVMSRAINVA